MSDLEVGEDGLARPKWAVENQLLRDYYDHEWGMPVRTETGIFERISLECFQAGLSWLTILRKRDDFRVAFAGFDPEIVSTFDETKIASLLSNDKIVRNRLKITATISNAISTLKLRNEGGLVDLVWGFQPTETPEPRTLAEIPTQSPESIALAKSLKSHGFKFIGPTMAYALMEAIGMVDTHLIGSHRRGSSEIWRS